MPRKIGLTFTDEMVRAILTGQKWQTRRPLASKPPRAEAGDWIWVREAWGVGTRPDPWVGCVDGIEYRADTAWLEESDMLPLYEKEPPGHVSFADYSSGWKPSIHMPKWAARIWLPLKLVWEDKVQHIGEKGAEAEGATPMRTARYNGQPQWRWYYDMDEDENYIGLGDHPRQAFELLWDTIYGNRPGLSWADNPWVRVYEWDPKKVEVKG